MHAESSVLDRTEMGRKKKTPTAQVRLAEDVVDLAWKIAPYHGYRQASDFLSDFLRPLLVQMERDQRAGKVSPMPKNSK